MSGSVAAYRRLWRHRWVPALLLVGVCARVPLQAYVFAVLLLTVERTGSYPVAGVVTAATGIAYAVAVPVHGRLVDRFGQTWPLRIASAVNAVAFTGLLVSAEVRPTAGLLAGWAAAVGLSLPPVAASARALWSRVIDDEAVRRTALAVDAMVLDIALIIGPLLVTAVSAAVGPGWAVGGCAVVLLGGTLWFSTLPPSRSWTPARRGGGLAGPLRSPGIVVLLVVSLLTGALLGVARIGFVEFADEFADGAAGGLGLAAFGAGSLLGGLAYGARSWRWDAAMRMRVILAGYACGVGALALAPNIPVLVALSLPAGFFLAPLVICTFELIGRCAPEGTLTEAFAWGITATFAGSALGNVVAGALAGAELSPGIAFAVAAGFAVLAAAIVTAGTKALADRSTHEAAVPTASGTDDIAEKGS
ncbi:MFS transporter [Spongiactinospora sp. TRM90649]|uniref:MFS transporter n=1 Tax=Spongiactinospora sp. TRM90649 TaxID=3031114 RepID=UPI0023F8B328|nr:MFS transporter [Spongiactinospora sp. TRM90649]MDF5752779.1 MFS transporter [Spongiactinospora sp. TRM90649]